GAEPGSACCPIQGVPGAGIASVPGGTVESPAMEVATNGGRCDISSRRRNAGKTGRETARSCDNAPGRPSAEWSTYRAASRNSATRTDGRSLETGGTSSALESATGGDPSLRTNCYTAAHSIAARSSNGCTGGSTTARSFDNAAIYVESITGDAI